MVTDLPDYTKQVTVVYVAPPTVQIGRVIASPTGEKTAKGSLDPTTAAYQNVCAYTVTSGKKFHLAKTLMICTTDSYFRILFGDEVLSPDIFVPWKTPFPDWYPYGWREVVGDGSKQIKIQAKYVDAAGIAYAELAGEETS